MSKLNLLVFLNAYGDSNPSNNPNKSNFKWERNLNSIASSNPQSNEIDLYPGETKTLFNGSRTLAQDGTTTYTLSLVTSTANTYQLAHSGGTAPNFRTPRTSGADATTQITVTLNGPVATFASTGGTALSLISGGVVVGDNVSIGNLFNVGNQGAWKIIALTATSFSVINADGAAEGPITLGAGFASQIAIFSAAGVQVGDTIKISGGFSPVTQGSYIVTEVLANSLKFYSTAILPEEGPIMTQAIAIYDNAKRLVYLESDQHVTMSLNGVSGDEINPLVDSAGCVRPGLFLRTSVVYSMTVTNVSEDTAKLFFASIE